MRKLSLFLGVVVVACCLIVTGCATNPPYKLDSGERVILTRGIGSVSCSYQELLNRVDSLLDYVSPHTKERSSGLDAMVMLRNGLEDMGIKTALVAINVQDNKPLYTCIAVETTDKGLVFLSLVEQSLGTRLNIDRSKYVQAVYLQKGQKIGFVEAEYAQQNRYSWYLEYLERFYHAVDFAEYLNEYENVANKNFQRLESIGQKLDAIYKDLERLRSSSFGWYQAPSDWEVYEFNRLVDMYNTKADRFDRNTSVYEAQADDYNTEYNKYETLSEGLSDFIYAVKEEQYPFVVPVYPMPPLYTAPDISAYLSSVPVALPSLSSIDTQLKFDDSYYLIPKPDMQSVDPFERISEENFVVKDFKLWW